MDAILTGEILKSLGEGNIPKALFNIAVFVLIWVEVHGLKKQFKKLNLTLENKFIEGETRFKQIEGRLTVLEKTNPKGV